MIFHGTTRWGRELFGEFTATSNPVESARIEKNFQTYDRLIKKPVKGKRHELEYIYIYIYIYIVFNLKRLSCKPVRHLARENTIKRS